MCSYRRILEFCTFNPVSKMQISEREFEVDIRKIKLHIMNTEQADELYERLQQ